MSAADQYGSSKIVVSWSYSWEGTVVPKVALVGKAVANETKLALLDILLDWVQKFLFRDLWSFSVSL